MDISHPIDEEEEGSFQQALWIVNQKAKKHGKRRSSPLKARRPGLFRILGSPQPSRSSETSSLSESHTTENHKDTTVAFAPRPHNGEEHFGEDTRARPRSPIRIRTRSPRRQRQLPKTPSNKKPSFIISNNKQTKPKSKRYETLALDLSMDVSHVFQGILTSPGGERCGTKPAVDKNKSKAQLKAASSSRKCNPPAKQDVKQDSLVGSVLSIPSPTPSCVSSSSGGKSSRTKTSSRHQDGSKTSECINKKDRNQDQIFHVPTATVAFPSSSPSSNLAHCIPSMRSLQVLQSPVEGHSVQPKCNHNQDSLRYNWHSASTTTTTVQPASGSLYNVTNNVTNQPEASVTDTVNTASSGSSSTRHHIWPPPTSTPEKLTITTTSGQMTTTITVFSSPSTPTPNAGVSGSYGLNLPIVVEIPVGDSAYVIQHIVQNEQDEDQSQSERDPPIPTLLEAKNVQETRKSPVQGMRETEEASFPSHSRTSCDGDNPEVDASICIATGSDADAVATEQQDDNTVLVGEISTNSSNADRPNLSDGSSHDTGPPTVDAKKQKEPAVPVGSENSSPEQVLIDGTQEHETVEAILTSSSDNNRSRVEIAPGTFVPLAGKQETLEFHRASRHVFDKENAIMIQCLQYGHVIHAIPTATHVLCPMCSIVHPFSRRNDLAESGLQSPKAALGFLMHDWQSIRSDAFCESIV